MKAKSTVSITFLPKGVVIEASQKDRTILKSALRAGFDIDHSCGGHGTCGTCVVTVLEGLEKLPPRGEIEQDMANDREFTEAERLCCQNPPREGLVLKVGRKKG